MSPIKLFLAFLFTLLTTTAHAAGPAKHIDWNDKQLQWLSYTDGMAKLKQTGQRGILIIYADWCGTCKAYSKFFYEPAVVSAMQGLVLMRVNKDAEPAVSKKFDNDGQYVPRTFALSSNGAILKQAYTRRDQFAYFISADDSDDLIQFLSRVKAVSQSQIGQLPTP